MIERLKHDLTHVDILIQNAAMYARGSIEEADVSDFDKQYQTNVRAPYVLTQALLPMLKSRRGQVVFINSSSGITARPLSAQYDATKHALKAIADSLRGEVNVHGVRVLSVYLGRTASEMQQRLSEMEGKPYTPETLLQPEDVASVVVNALSLPRTAEVTDIWIRPAMKPENRPGRDDRNFCTVSICSWPLTSVAKRWVHQVFFRDFRYRERPRDGKDRIVVANPAGRIEAHIARK